MLRRLVLFGLVLGLVLTGCAVAGRLPFGGRECPPVSAWRLETMDGSKLRRLEPACAREGLEKAVAFYAARFHGVSVAEALTGLGVTILHQPVGREVRVLWPDREDTVRLSGPLGLMDRDLTIWTVGQDRLAPVGCFTPLDPTLGGYRILCWMMELNQNGTAYMRLADLTLRMVADRPFELWHLWGVTPEETWVHLGAVAWPEEPASLRLAQQEAWARVFGSTVQTPAGVIGAYGLRAQPLPPGADTWPTDERALAALTDALKARMR